MDIMVKIKKDAERKQKYKCTYPDCNWVFTCNYKLQRHIRSHTGEKPFQCQQCKVKFSTQYNLLSHLKSHTRIKCSYSGCKEVFNTKNEEEKHVRDYHIHSFKCPKKRCAEFFNSLDDLEMHLSNHGKQYSCGFENCQKTFTKPSLLKQHMMIHSGELPFKCDFLNCNKGFATRQRLIRHTSIHENKRSFLCNVEKCGKRFNHADYLKTHMRTHNSEKIVKCPLENCQHTFACSETLKVHIRRHNNIRPYKCSEPNCGRSYLTISNLKAHEKTHKIGKCIRRRSTDMSKTKKEESNMTIESISVNEFLNVKVYETPNSTEICEDLNQQSIVAKYGEIICNAYMNTSKGHMNDQNIEEQIPGWSGEEVIPIISEGRSNVSDIDIQFQEEFVSNIYVPCSINNFGVFDSGHDYERTEIIGSDTNEALFLTSTDLQKLDDDPGLPGNDIDTLESSMELSTGHLVIDGGYLGASTYMPDHIYSHRNLESKSTVNLSDIQ